MTQTISKDRGKTMKPYYQDDYVTIYNCRCEDILGELPKVDLVLTDPPYGIKRFEKLGNEKSGVYIERLTFKQTGAWNNNKPVKDLLDIILNKSKKQIIWGGNNFELPTSEYFFIWDKKQVMPNFAQCEMAWVSQSMHKTAKIFEYDIKKLNGQQKVHPTEKPIELMRWCIDKADEPQTILDPFAGSCTTGRAAKDLGRKCICIELEEKYCEIGAKRMCQEVMNFK